MTPLDIVNSLKGKDVIVQLKNGREITGKLLSFDLSANIGIETKNGTEFIHGETVVAMSETKR